MNAVGKSMLGMVVTAGAVYFFDPVSGHRRRLLLRDTCSRAARNIDLGTRDARHDFSHRVHDLAVKTKTHVKSPTSDKAIYGHVRKAIKHAVSHPAAIGCIVRDGNVYLRGDVYSHELQRLLDEIRSVQGVRVVTDHLIAREAGEGVRPLANGSGRVGDGWSVTGRVLAGAAGCALLAWGVRERKALREFGTTVGHKVSSAGHKVWDYSKHALDARIDDITDAIEDGIDSAGRMAEELAREAREAGDIEIDVPLRSSQADTSAKELRARASA
jgi:hypothetical protein